MGCEFGKSCLEEEKVLIAHHVPSGNQTAVKDDVLPGGIKIPAGTLVIYLIYAMNRDPELWPDPLRFDPERFVRRPAASMSM